MSPSDLAWMVLAFGLAAGNVGAATHYQALKSFGGADTRGQYPQAPVIVGSDGFLYGTTSGGGANGVGTVFRVRTDGGGYTVLRDLGPGGASRQPQGGLLEASDGALYGTTWAGGADDAGIVFRVGKDGNYTVLHSFRADGNDGRRGVGELIEGRDGALYGVTLGGGTNGAGTVFRLPKDGGGYAILHHFSLTVAGIDPAAPKAGLIQGSDGVLYGAAAQGGIGSGLGAVYRLNPDGSGYAVLHSFGQKSGEGIEPRGRLLEGSDGVLYGTAASGGTSGGGALGAGNGAVFRIGRDGSGFRELHLFSGGGADGYQPIGGLTEGNDGRLYGTASQGGVSPLVAYGVLFSLNKDGSDFRALHTFGATEDDGGHPAAGVTLSKEGVFYGTTQMSGSTAGTVFQLATDGVCASLVRFPLAEGDGVWPQVPLLQGKDGAWYGTANYGGGGGLGTVFRLSPDGSGYRLVHEFPAFRGDGYRPEAGLLEGEDGALYGATSCGGEDNLGTVYRLQPDGSGYRILHHFRFTASTGASYGMPVTLGAIRDGFLYGTTAGLGTHGLGTAFRIDLATGAHQVLRDFAASVSDPTGGWYPRGALLIGGDGLLYGTTSAGGPGTVGTAFRLNPDGTGFQVLHGFSFLGEGNEPQAGMIEGSDGALYGTTTRGGANGLGTLFKLSKDGQSCATLHDFSSADGGWPTGGVVEGPDGALYGTTASNSGAVYRVRKDGTAFERLHRFVAGYGAEATTDGSNPVAGLRWGTDGALYGTTKAGGQWGYGTVFRLLPPESPDLLGLSRTAEGVRVTLAGTAGCQYEVLQSSDLLRWSSLSTFTMPESGLATCDHPQPAGSSSFYRAVWHPRAR